MNTSIQSQIKILRTQIAMVSLTLSSMQAQLDQMEGVITGKQLPMLKTNPDHFMADSEPVSCDEDHVLIKVGDSSESEYDSDTAPSLPRAARRVRTRARYRPVPSSALTDYSSGYDS
jgi:hypothetical protein